MDDTDKCVINFPLMKFITYFVKALELMDEFIINLVEKKT